MQLLRAVNAFFNKFISVFITTVFSLMTVIIFVQVVCRYVLQDSLSWSDELARYLFIWLTFLGASVAFHEDTHIKVTYFVDMIRNAKLRAVVYTLADMACLWLLWVFVKDGFVVSSRVLALGQTSSSMEFIPVGLIYLAVPLGSLFMALNIIQHALERVQIIVGKEA